MTKPTIDRYIADGPSRLLTDDRPWAEFLAPRLMYERTVDQTLGQLIPYYESPLPLLRFTGLDNDAETLRVDLQQRYEAHRVDLQGLRLYYGGPVGAEPEVEFKKALAIDPDDANARYYLREIGVSRAKLFVRWRDVEKGEPYLLDLLNYVHDEPRLYLALGDLYAGAGRRDDAIRAFRTYGVIANDPAGAHDRIQTLDASSVAPPSGN